VHPEKFLRIGPDPVGTKNYELLRQTDCMTQIPAVVVHVVVAVGVVVVVGVVVGVIGDLVVGVVVVGAVIVVGVVVVVRVVVVVDIDALNIKRYHMCLYISYSNFCFLFLK